jgi:NhaP-type Na+/H+ and K+/H+ antiporter
LEEYPDWAKAAAGNRPSVTQRKTVFLFMENLLALAVMPMFLMIGLI